MDFSNEYRQKKITVQEALAKIRDNDIIAIGHAGCEPTEQLMHLHEIDDRVKNVRVETALEFSSFPFQEPERKVQNIKALSFFFGGPSRKLQPLGRSSLLPSHLHNFSKCAIAHHKPNIFMATVSPMDRFGYFHLSMALVHERPLLDAADLVILEVNPQMPRVLGDTQVHISEVDFLIETDHPLVTMQPVPPGEKELAVGKIIAELVNDGDTIQLGIGGIPNAVAAGLRGKRELGIHTEMFTESMMELMEAGVITNRKKTLHRGKAVAAFAFGSQKLYDFLAENPAIAMMDGAYVNDPYVIAQNDNMVSINTTLQVDLTGQCCSESIGSRQYSGIGGQADTAIGAQMSRNGRSIIALLSTTRDESISKISPILTPGAAVTLSRNDVDFVVTEYGVAALRGRSVGERAEALIAIAHPKFREELRAAAIEQKIW